MVYTSQTNRIVSCVAQNGKIWKQHVKRIKVLCQNRDVFRDYDEKLQEFHILPWQSWCEEESLAFWTGLQSQHAPGETNKRRPESWDTNINGCCCFTPLEQRDPSEPPRSHSPRYQPKLWNVSSGQILQGNPKDLCSADEKPVLSSLDALHSYPVKNLEVKADHSTVCNLHAYKWCGEKICAQQWPVTHHRVNRRGSFITLIHITWGSGGDRKRQCCVQATQVGW